MGSLWGRPTWIENVGFVHRDDAEKTLPQTNLGGGFKYVLFSTLPDQYFSNGLKPPTSNIAIFLPLKRSVVTLPETNSQSTCKGGPKPRRKHPRIPTIHFQVLLLLVSGSVVSKFGISLEFPRLPSIFFLLFQGGFFGCFCFRSRCFGVLLFFATNKMQCV